MMAKSDFVIEDAAEGRSLVVTGSWSSEVARRASQDDVPCLVLNYARGFSEPNLEFLNADLKVHSLEVLDRAIDDLDPVLRLAGTLRSLSIQAAPQAKLDLGLLPRLRYVTAEWEILRSSVTSIGELRRLVTWRFDEPDLLGLRNQFDLEALTIKDAPNLESLEGLGDLARLQALTIVRARRLRDVGGLVGRIGLQDLILEDCPQLFSLAGLESLTALRSLSVSECGDLASLAPIRQLKLLESFSAWGSTRVADLDLSPLGELPNLREIRMRDRRGYRPRVGDFAAAV